MMNVSAPAGLSDSRANSQRNGHSGLGFAPPRGRIGWARWTLGTDHGRQEHHQDDHHGREEHVLHHGFTQEGNPFLQLFLVFHVVGLGVDHPPGRRGLADAAPQHQPEVDGQECEQRAGDDEDVQGKEPAQGVAADHWASQHQANHPGPSTGVLPAMEPRDGQSPVRVGVPAQDLAGEEHPERAKQQEDAR